MDDSAAAALVVSIFVLFVAGLCFGVGCCMHARRHVLAETVRKNLKYDRVSPVETEDEDDAANINTSKNKKSKSDAAAKA